MFFRLIKSNWGKQYINDEINPGFVRDIPGPNIYEGCFDEQYINDKNQVGYNIYFFPNHPASNIYTNEKKFLSGKDIDTFNYVFVDMDLKDKIYKSKEAFYDKLATFKLLPTMTIDSGHGVHAYWSVSDLSRDAYVMIQLSLISHFKSDASIWTTLQLMRYPGSLNTKESNNFRSVVDIQKLCSGKSYTVASLLVELPPLTEFQQNKMVNHLNKLEGNSIVHISEDINVDELPDSFIDLMYNNDQIYQLFTNPTEFYGDRSSADMKLVNILYNQGISKNDAFAAISNSQKALSKGIHRFEYSIGTVDKAYVDRTKNKFQTVDQKLKNNIQSKAGDPVFGPGFLDCLYHKWKKKQVMGLIAGPGIGKTSLTLYAFKEMIKNNKDNDDVFIFFSLEMPEEDIISAWTLLIGNDSELNKRLYVIGNEDENDEPRNIGIQQIQEYAEDIKKATGKNIAAVAIDHIGVLSTVIDMTKKYTFGGDQEPPRYGSNIRTLTINNLCTQMKDLAKLLDTFLIVLTQTTKAKGVGDIPVEKDGAYGISQYENIMDYILTVWQPLMRVQSLTDHYFLAWQYAKIRKKHKNDRVQTQQHKLLTYDMDSGNLKTPTESEYMVFVELLPAAMEARETSEKKKCSSYSKSLSIEELDNVANKLKQ